MEPGKNMNELSLTEFVLVLVTRLKTGHKKAVSLGIIPVAPRSLLLKPHLPSNELDPSRTTSRPGLRKFYVSLELLVAVTSCCSRK